MDEKELGRLIRELRVERKISVRCLAKRMGVAPSSISRFERGHATLAGEKLAKVMAYFGISSKLFVNGKADIVCKRCLFRQTIDL